MLLQKTHITTPGNQESIGFLFLALIFLVTLGTLIVTHPPRVSQSASAGTTQHYQSLFTDTPPTALTTDPDLTYRDNFVGP